MRTGTPAQLTKPSDDASLLSTDDNRTRRKNTPGDQSMRRSIQDLVSSIDPNVKIEPEVEDVRFHLYEPRTYMNIPVAPARHCRRVHRLSDQLRLPAGQAPRRGYIRGQGSPTTSRSVEFIVLVVVVTDLRIERNHNIRIPGFASDETRISLSQMTAAPAAPAATANKKGNTQGAAQTPRSQRLAQLQTAKREAKLI